MMLLSVVREFKTWFSYVRKIPGDRGFYFLLTVPDFAYISVNHQKSGPDSPDFEFGGKWKVNQKLKFVHKCMIGRLEIIADVPDGTNLSFHLSGIIAGHCRNLGRVGKMQTFPILQICR